MSSGFVSIRRFDLIGNDAVGFSSLDLPDLIGSSN